MSVWLDKRVQRKITNVESSLTKEWKGLMSESIGNMKEKFLTWEEAFERKRLKINLKKAKVMVNGLKGEVLKSKVDPCVKCG